MKRALVMLAVLLAGATLAQEPGGIPWDTVADWGDNPLILMGVVLVATEVVRKQPGAAWIDGPILVPLAAMVVGVPFGLFIVLVDAITFPPFSEIQPLWLAGASYGAGAGLANFIGLEAIGKGAEIIGKRFFRGRVAAVKEVG